MASSKKNRFFHVKLVLVILLTAMSVGSCSYLQNQEDNRKIKSQKKKQDAAQRVLPALEKNIDIAKRCMSEGRIISEPYDNARICGNPGELWVDSSKLKFTKQALCEFEANSTDQTFSFCIKIPGSASYKCTQDGCVQMTLEDTKYATEDTGAVFENTLNILEEETAQFDDKDVRIAATFCRDLGPALKGQGASNEQIIAAYEELTKKQVRAGDGRCSEFTKWAQGMSVFAEDTPDKKFENSYTSFPACKEFFHRLGQVDTSRDRHEKYIKHLDSRPEGTDIEKDCSERLREIEPTFVGDVRASRGW